MGGGEWFRRTFTPCVDRKGRLKSQFDVVCNEYLSRRFAPAVVSHLKTESTRSAKETKVMMKAIPGAKSTVSVSMGRLSALVDIQNATLFDFTAINPDSVPWTKPLRTPR